MNFLFPSVSNKKGSAEISLEDFAPIVKKVEVTPDLTFKDGKFRLKNSFLEGRTETTGFVTVLKQDETANGIYYKGYILKSTTPETYEHTKFVRGVNAVNTFSSDSAKFVIETSGFIPEKGVFLHQQESVDGWDVFLIQDTPKVETEEVEQSIEPQAEVESYAQVGVEELSFSDEPIEDLV